MLAQRAVERHGKTLSASGILRQGHCGYLVVRDVCAHVLRQRTEHRVPSFLDAARIGLTGIMNDLRGRGIARYGGLRYGGLRLPLNRELRTGSLRMLVMRRTCESRMTSLRCRRRLS